MFMKRIKNISLILVNLFVLVCSAIIFAGCGDDSDTSQLFVFATEGGCVQVNDNSNYVEYGDEGEIFTFKEDTKVNLKAIADVGYSFVKWEFAESFDDDFEILSSKAEISFVIDEDEIVIRAVFELSGEVTYNIAYPETMIGYNIVAVEGYQTTVVSGGEFKFKVNLEETYSNSVILVKANDNVLVEQNGIYTVSNITDDITISVVGVLYDTYTITEQDARFDIKPINYTGKYAVEGSNYIFEITLNDGYKFGDSVVVKANGKVLEPNGNQYTVENVIENVAITVDGIEAEVVKYSVTLPTALGYTLTKVDGTNYSDLIINVEKGQNLEFKVKLDDDYSQSVITVKANNETITPNADGVYTVLNINSDVVIAVEGVEINQPEQPTIYTISTEDTRFEIKPENYASNTVLAGGNYIFTIQLKEGYEFVTTPIVKANENILTEVDGKYTINAINENTIISVTGIGVIKYTITIPTGEGYKITSTDDSSFSNTNIEVDYAGDFEFKVKLDEDYLDSDIVVKNGTQTLQPDANGIYSIENILNDIEITVEGVVKTVTYLITVPVDEHYTLLNADGTTAESNKFEVKHGEVLSFMIVSDEGEVSIKANGEEVVAVNQVFSIVVTGNVSIQVIVGMVQKEVTYNFNLSFQESVGELLGDTSQSIPETISFTIDDNQEKKSQYISYEFVLETSLNEQTNIRDLVQTINNYLMSVGMETMKYFSINGTQFISVDNDTDEMTIDWSLIEDGTQYNMEIVVL